MEIRTRVQELAQINFDFVQAVRRHLHKHPELSFKEFKTAEFIANSLKEMGIPFEAGIAGTGIVAMIEGKDPTSRMIALRADMDALPILERNQVPYTSVNEGVMHACGHDVHSACLIGAAKILFELRHEFTGSIRLIFQPGEEKLPGGASLMIKEGVLENPRPSGIIGQHVFPELTAGKVGFRSGPYMASADELYIKIIGKGGHGAMPHKNIDPILIGSHLVVALQQIVSRVGNATIPSVLSIGKFIADGATNVIPSEAYLEGTFRTFNEEWRAEAHAKMKAMAEELVSSMGGQCEFEIRRGYPFLVNDPLLTSSSKDAAIEYLGAENVVDLDLRMTAEDFSYYSQVVPACFYRLGTAGAHGEFNNGVHHPEFDINEKALTTGSGLMAYLAIKSLIS